MIRNELRTSKKYLLDPKTFKSDIEKIFINAKTYNANQTDIFQAAIKVHDKASQILNNKKLIETIDAHSKCTIDEGLFSQYRRKFHEYKKEGKDPLKTLSKPPLHNLKSSSLLLALE